MVNDHQPTDDSLREVTAQQTYVKYYEMTQPCQQTNLLEMGCIMSQIS